MTYDERKRQLTRVVTTDKETETTEWRIVLNERGIKNIWTTLVKEKKEGQKARQKHDSILSSYKKQLEDVKEVKLTKQQQDIKEALKVLQKDAERENLQIKVKDAEASIEYIDKQISEKNKMMNDLKSKVKNLGLS